MRVDGPLYLFELERRHHRHHYYGNQDAQAEVRRTMGRCCTTAPMLRGW
jgi:hypothetical protein